MRSRTPLLALLFVVGSFALPYIAHAAVGTFFGPIIPDAYKTCPGGWGLLMVVVNNIIEFLLTVAIDFVAPIMIAYSGFLYVVNPVDPSGIAKAKGILLNTIVGIVVALAAWMIVDAIMAVLYNQNAQVNGGALGVWSSLLTTQGDACLPQAGSMPGAELNQATSSTIGVAQLGNLLGMSTAQCPSTSPACSPAALQRAGFTATQANVMSCIAVTESSGNADKGCVGNACGLFQIMLTSNQLVGPDCGGTLDCPSLCKGNNGGAVTTASCQPCVKAAANAACNAESAQHISSLRNNPYWAWTPPASDNPNSAACVQKYSGS